MSTIKLGALDDRRVVDAAVIGDHHHAIGFRGHRDGILRGQLVIVQTQRWNERIAVSDARSAALQQQDDIQRGRFAHIVDIALVRDAQNVHVRAFERLGMLVERVLNLVHHEVRHLAVDVSGQLDKTRLDAGLLGFPGEIKRIDRNAVAAQARARIERHESERLGGRGVDHFPDVDAHAIAHQRHFVDQADIDHAEGVFEQLHHLGHAGGADRHHLFKSLRIEQRAQLGACGRNAAHHFRDVRGLVLRVAGIDALRRKTQEEVLAHLPAGRFQHGQNQLVGGSRIGGGFQNHQLAGPEVFRRLLAGGHDVTHVRIFGLAQGRGHRDVDGIEVRND